MRFACFYSPAQKKRSAAGRIGPIRFAARSLDQAFRTYQTKENRTCAVERGGDELLTRLKRSADGVHLFPGRIEGHPLEDVKNVWAEVCKTAEIENCRIHDLRHTYASHLVSSGIPLAIVGKLLGHTQSQTTERCPLADSALRRATDLFGRKVNKGAGKKK